MFPLVKMRMGYDRLWKTALVLAAAGWAVAEEPAPGPAEPAEPAPAEPAPVDPAPAEPAPVSPDPEPAQDPESVQEPEPARTPGQDAKRKDRHVVSQSRMFSVSGGDAMRMGAIAQKADEVRAQLNSLLQDDAKWRYAISIRLIGQQEDAPMPNPIRIRIRIIGGEPNLQIRVHAGGGVNLDQLTQSLVSMLLFERAIRDVPADALPEKLDLPPWLVTGIRQALLWRSGKVDRRLYRNLFEQSEMLTPEEIISTPVPAELDAAARQVYDVSCGVLVMSLLSRPKGPLQLRELVSEAVTAEGTPAEIIGSHFVELGVDAESLNRWWALELASLSQPRATDALTPMETEEQLREALTMLYFDQDEQVPVPVSVEDVYSLMEVPEWKKLLRPCLNKLMVLNMSCFPDYRPIIGEYVRAISMLLRDSPPEDVLQVIGPLREIREGYVKSSLRGRDYLDWYEITQQPGGKQQEADFQAYLSAMSLLRQQEAGLDTVMSRYLEDIESLYQLQEDSPLPDRMLEELGRKKDKNGKGKKK